MKLVSEHSNNIFVIDLIVAADVAVVSIDAVCVVRIILCRTPIVVSC